MHLTSGEFYDKRPHAIFARRYDHDGYVGVPQAASRYEV